MIKRNFSSEEEAEKVRLSHQGGKFVGCAEDLRRRDFDNLLHFGAELWKK